MRAVVQRVHAARVEVAGEIVGAIDQGLLAFVGAGAGDADADLEQVAKKLVALRVFEDERGKMARSVGDVRGALLLVSQFTLFGDLSRGNRPSFTTAMPPDEARPFFDRFVARVRELTQAADGAALRVETGRFGADMRVVADNDGPVTILLDSRAATG